MPVERTNSEISAFINATFEKWEIASVVSTNLVKGSSDMQNITEIIARDRSLIIMPLTSKYGKVTNKNTIGNMEQRTKILLRQQGYDVLYVIDDESITKPARASAIKINMSNKSRILHFGSRIFSVSDPWEAICKSDWFRLLWNVPYDEKILSKKAWITFESELRIAVNSTILDSKLPPHDLMPFNRTFLFGALRVAEDTIQINP